jgi:ADP-ribosylglycohydrolase
MLGAIAGDIIGSPYEASPVKHKDFPLFSDASRFTDDTVLTVAVADCILHGRDYVEAFHEYTARHPRAGYGGTFARWAFSRATAPYNSWGNGSAMRVSPVGWAARDAQDVLSEAERSAEATHNHPEGVKGAQATALAVFLARTGSTRDAIREEIAAQFGYDLDRSLDDIRATYTFDVSCQGSVPESLISFLESTDFEDAVRNAVSLGGDADTMACIAGAVAEAFYGGVPPAIEAASLDALTPDLVEIVDLFRERYCETGQVPPNRR